MKDLLNARRSLLGALKKTVKTRIGERCAREPAFQAAVDFWLAELPIGGILADRRTREAGIERAAQFSVHWLLIQLFFYQALRARFTLPPLSGSASDAGAETLRLAIAHGFEIARRLDPPYRWIFGAGFEENLPISCLDLVFCEGVAPAPLIDWLGQFAGGDGADRQAKEARTLWLSIAEPGERRSEGAPNPAPPAADLIQAFCLRERNARLLAFGAGAGVLLMRALRRKQFLDPQRAAGAVLSELYGVDASPYGLPLATAGLVLHDLTGTNALDPTPSAGHGPVLFPRDFFDVSPNSPAIPSSLDAIVATLTSAPVYEDLQKRKIQRALLVDTLKHGVPWLISGGSPDASSPAPYPERRGDTFLASLLHSLGFLREGGYIGFMTPDSWLESEYGADLQKLILERFRLIALMQCEAGSAFPSENQSAIITILCKDSEAASRESSLAKFVRFKAPLTSAAEGQANGDAGAADSDPARVEALVRRIEGEEELFHDSPSYRWTSVRQRDLMAEGLAVPSDAPGGPPASKYAGGKWGRYLRAPDVFFRIIERAPNAFCRLVDCADVRRGVTTGANEFFFLQDITDDLSDDELHSSYGLRRINTGDGIRVVESARASQADLRVARDGQGSVHVIEAEYLQPAVKSPREVRCLDLPAARLTTRLLVVHEDKSKLKGSRVLDYLKYGERRAYHRRPTCAARERWFDLGQMHPPDFLILKSYKDRLMILDNGLQEWLPIVWSSDRFYAVNLRSRSLGPSAAAGAPRNLLAAILNSSPSLLMLELYGQSDKETGSLDLAAHEVSLLPIWHYERWPAALAELPKEGADPAAARLLKAYHRLTLRPILPIFEELVLPDRQELDDAFLSLIGFTEPAERMIVRADLYAAVRGLMESRIHPTATAGYPVAYPRATVAAMAADLWQAFDPARWRRFPIDFLPAVPRPVDVLRLAPGQVTVEKGLFGRGQVFAGEEIYDLGSAARAEFTRTAVSQYRGGSAVDIPVPRDAQICADALEDYRRHLGACDRDFQAAAQSKTADAALQKRLVKELQRLRDHHLSSFPDASPTARLRSSGTSN